MISPHSSLIIYFTNSNKSCNFFRFRTSGYSGGFHPEWVFVLEFQIFFKSLYFFYTPDKIRNRNTLLWHESSKSSVCEYLQIAGNPGLLFQIRLFLPINFQTSYFSFRNVAWVSPFKINFPDHLIILICSSLYFW